MFIGHFGVGFGAKRVTPGISLGLLFIAAQFIDLLWPTFLLLNIEQVQIVQSTTSITPLQFTHYPFSHSLLAVILWSLLVGGVYWKLRQEWFGAIVLGLLVLSHWFLDLIVHQPDLPLYPGSTIKAGFGVWSSLPLTLLVEGSLFLIGVWLYFRATVARDSVGRWGLWGLVATLLLIYAGNLFGAPPPSVTAIAILGQLQWSLVLWGFWIDSHRIFRASR